MYVYVSGGKKCQFFGKFSARTTWVIPVGSSMVSFLVDFKQMYAHSRNVFRTLSNILKLLTIFSKSSIFDRLLTLQKSVCIRVFLVRMRENTDQKFSKHEHFLHNVTMNDAILFCKNKDFLWLEIGAFSSILIHVFVSGL